MDSFGGEKTVSERHFFVSPAEFGKETVILRGSEARHIAKVLRLQVGAEIEILNGLGEAATAEIIKIEPETVHCRKIQAYFPPGCPSLKVTLLQGLAKGEKMDQIIQKSVELGVSQIIPLACERSVVQLSGSKAKDRQERWQRIALEAAKQCRRPDIPVVAKVQTWAEALEAMPLGALPLMLWEGEKEHSFREIWNLPIPPEIYLMVGPEGGLTEAEVQNARRHQTQTFSLGSRILRTETAGPAALALLMHWWGDLR